MLLFALGFSAFAQNATIHLELKDVPLSTALKQISVQSDYRFVYNNNLVDVSSKVSISIQSSDIKAVLDKLFYGLDISYVIVNKQVALSQAKGKAKAGKESQKAGTRTVTGIVTDENGEPMPGADVFQMGTTNGAFTDKNGQFSIILPDNQDVQLVFNFIGMKPDTVRVGSRELLDVSMALDTKVLDQVVVTGYQTLSRERSAGSFAKVEGASIQDKANAQGNVLKSLEGTVAGLSVQNTADGSSYLIRGVTSINSKTTPLFIVDGVSMAQDLVEKIVSGNDVASVTFLKDVTAASIWGAQAANGVVVITTKTGSGSKKLTISYNGSFTYKGKPIYSYQDQMTSADFIKTATEIFDPNTYSWDEINKSAYGIAGGTYATVFPHELPLYQYYLGQISLAERDAALSKLAAQDGRTDYEKYFMSNAFLTNHSLSFSGSSDRNSYYVSLEYQGNQGIEKDHTNEYKAYIRDLLDITRKVKLDLSLNAYHSDHSSHILSSGSDSPQHLTKIPYALFYGDDGSELSFTHYIMNSETQTAAQTASGVNLDYYPISDYTNSTNGSQSYTVRANAGLTVNLLDWLTYEGRFQYSINNANTKTYYPGSTYKVRFDRVCGTSQDGTSYLPASGGYFTMGDSYNASYTVRNQLSFDKSFEAFGNSSNQITALAGFEVNSDKYSAHSEFMRGYDMQTMQHVLYNDYYLNITGVRDPVLSEFAGSSTNTFDPNSYSESETEYRFVSAYANAAYTLKDRYSINASVRVDQSNLFGSDPSVQFKPIWSVGGIWNMRKESFMESAEKVDNLNLRLSYGFAGNSPDPGKGGPYDIIASVTNPNYSKYGLGYVISTPANDKLTWEKTRTWNIGLDFSFFGNRLGGSIDVYDKKTTDLLAYNPIDPTSGYTTVLSNIGTMTNKGVELSLNTVNVQSRDFTWSTDFNITYNKNKLVEMYVTPPSSPSMQISQEYWEGYPVGTIFAYKWAGLDPETGMPRVYDSKGDIVESVSDIDDIAAVPYQGTTIPPWYGSLTNSIRYKSFELSFMFIYNLGNVMRNDINTQYSYRLTSSVHNDFAKRWKQPGDELTTNVPAYYSLKSTTVNENDVLTLYQYADINVLDASYIKLRDVSLSYSLSQKACKAISAQSASVRLQVSNLWLIPFNKEGIDPEAFYLSSGGRGELYRPSFTASFSIDF